MHYAFPYHIKMDLRGLKMLTLRVHIIVCVMTIALIHPRHRCMKIGFTQQIMVFLVTK